MNDESNSTMGISFFPSGIETLATNPRLRDTPEHDIARAERSAIVEGEVAAIRAATQQYLAQNDAAIALIHRTPECEATMSGPAIIQEAGGFKSETAKSAFAQITDMFREAANYTRGSSREEHGIS